MQKVGRNYYKYRPKKDVFRKDAVAMLVISRQRNIIMARTPQMLTLLSLFFPCSTRTNRGRKWYPNYTTILTNLYGYSKWCSARTNRGRKSVHFCQKYFPCRNLFNLDGSFQRQKRTIQLYACLSVCLFMCLSASTTPFVNLFVCLSVLSILLTLLVKTQCKRLKAISLNPF